MWISKKTHYSNLDMLAKMMDENYELRKVCWCKDCKWYAENEVCVNGDSDNRAEFMNQYSSCEKCERR